MYITTVIIVGLYGSLMLQVNGHNMDCRKRTEYNLGPGVCLCAIFHGGCILECRDKPTSYCLAIFYTHVNNLILIIIRPYTHLLH